MTTLDDFFAWATRQRNLERAAVSAANSRVYRLERMHAIAQHFGNPQRTFKTIHVAGSKGKSSTVSVLTHAIAATGQTVGGFLSPHVLDYRERIVILPHPLGDAAMGKIAQTVWQQSTAIFGDAQHPQTTAPLAADPPTTFELLTIFAFLCFRQARCQWAVVECGLGGRLDATNIVAPTATVITPLELEHTHYLGADIKHIAFEKAGIIKQKIPLFVATQSDAALSVIKNVAHKKNAPLFLLDDFLIKYDNDSDNRVCTLHIASSIDQAHIDTMQCRLTTVVLDSQIENIALAFLVFRHCFSKVSTAAFWNAIPRGALKGRFDMPFNDASIVFDGAHTPLSLQAVVHAFNRLYGLGGTCIFGCALDKQHTALLRLLADKFKTYLLTEYDTLRSRPAETLALHLKKYGVPDSQVTIHKQIDTIPKQIAHTVRSNRPLLICGSFYLVGALYPRIRRLLRK